MLWMLSENYIKNLLLHHNLKPIKTFRFHITSSLMYKLRMKESKAAEYIKYDSLLNGISYWLTHNVILQSQNI